MHPDRRREGRRIRKLRRERQRKQRAFAAFAIALTNLGLAFEETVKQLDAFAKQLGGEATYFPGHSNSQGIGTSD